jgi:hypothetical protein
MSLGEGRIGSPRNLIAATKHAAISRAPFCFCASTPTIIGEHKANIKPKLMATRFLNQKKEGARRIRRMPHLKSDHPPNGDRWTLWTQ